MTALSAMNPRPPDPERLLPPAARPRVALVLLSGGDPATLESALGSLAEPCRVHEVRILVVWPAAASSLAALGRTYAEVDFFPVSPVLPPLERRAEGAHRANAEILLFVEDREAAGVRWGEVLPTRVGLVRSTGDARPEVDWPAQLRSLGVSEPGAA